MVIGGGGGALISSSCVSTNIAKMSGVLQVSVWSPCCLLLVLVVMLQNEVNTGFTSPLGLSKTPCGIINHHLVKHLVLITAWRNVQMWWPAIHMAIASII